MRDTLAARLPFWIYAGSWVVFVGVLTYLLWPVSSQPFVEIQLYSYLVYGETITLIAKPNPNQRVQAWSGADTLPFTGENVNSLIMPAADRTVNAAYENCFILSGSISGQGEPITAKPAASAGCAGGSITS
ncbi:MAG: hypothetical protein HGA82_03455 [Anaerolineales bacterium]|nr:hypothetical protein [Anaerolineales bacterium]